ncbi:hypothetical protein CANINC_004265 [Pichia inconspicua]|uniref:CNH domain-containing protein n=1 Tax=Pichia inconspicua TaxID=52247 RepID=A0A4T0WWH0_9ASCO|nr:hypothetical protein CANINC_004265 [[Candida] inconspicua]
MEYGRGSRAKGRHEDLKSQFASLPASMPLDDIPSLPAPKVVSPIQEYPLQPQSQHQHQIQIQNQQSYNHQQQMFSSHNYDRNGSSSSIPSSTRQMSNPLNSNYTSNQQPIGHISQKKGQPIYSKPYPQSTHQQQDYFRPTTERILSSESGRNNDSYYVQQQNDSSRTTPIYSNVSQNQLGYKHNELPPPVERKLSNPYFAEQQYQHTYQQQQQQQYQQQQYIYQPQSQPQQSQTHLHQHHYQQLSQVRSVPYKSSTNNTDYISRDPAKSADQPRQRIPTNLSRLNTQLASEQQYKQFGSPMSLQTTPIQSIASPESSERQHTLYESRELLPGKAFGIKQRQGSESLPSNHQRDYQRSPSLPTKETFEKLTGGSKTNTLQDTTPASPSRNGSIKTSPIVRQSINFLTKARNFSVSSNNGQPESPIYAGHSSSREMEKYHLPQKQVTSSGRVVPQRINYSSSSSMKKSRSFNSLTKRVASSSSLRGAAEKNKFVSSTSLNSAALTATNSIRKRYIYPALLSEVADAFLHEIKLGCHFKYGIEYRNSFSGAEAVDVICSITKIRDRNLAIILGRALDAQRLFHDVSYEHKLRDNRNEIYMLSDELSYDQQNDTFRRQDSVTSMNNNDEFGSSMTSLSTMTNEKPVLKTSVNGVFTLLTECYSPTCTRDKLCYSVSCPRRFEQKMRSEMQNGNLVRSDSHISFDHDEQKQYWQLTVPKEVVESLDKREVKRQECIFETINSEKTFIKDLEYIREFWMRPLSETKIIKDKERDQFIRNVFHNINEIWDVNHRFAEALVRRQQKSPIVDTIADIFLEYIPQFTPFITYGAGQVIGKYEFDRQRRHNALLRRFIEDTAKREESKRLDLSSFLSKPTTRPARYPLLLKSIRDHTDPESPDYKKLGEAIELLEKILTKINFETGKQSDKMNLFQIKQKLLFKPGELVDLKLSAENRKMIYQCTLKKKGYQDKEKQGEIHVYLFDHCLLFVKLGYLNKREVYKVYQRPIPLPLLFMSTSELPPTIRAIRKAAQKNGSSLPLIGTNSSSGMVPLNSTVSKSPISFKYLGIHGYELTLYGTPAAQKILTSKIEAQTKKILSDNDVYTLTPLCSNFFDAQNRINCVVPYDGGRKLLYGTDSGIYISDRTDTNMARNKVISKVNIIQAEIIQEYQILIALCDKKLLCWPTSVLAGGDATKNAKLGKELMNHVSFFKIGICDGRMLLCAAKSTSNIVRIFEPIDPVQQKKKKNMFVNNKEDIHFSSEPVSISFLKTKLCVGCSNGFQIVSLVNNSMEELLDPADTSLEFATSKEGLKPLSIDRINSDFLLSYSSFSFFINHNGWRVRPKWMIEWEGIPHQFALWYPYLLAFDSNFIEIRSVQNAELLRVIVGENIRFLHASSQEILYAYVDDRGYDVVASLDFWDKSMKSRSRTNTTAEEKSISIESK